MMEYSMGWTLFNPAQHTYMYMQASIIISKAKMNPQIAPQSAFE
jgi:hypothetical protein